MTAAAEAPALSRARRLTLIATVVGSSMTFVDATVVNIALPSVARDLGMGLAGQQWVVLAYSLAVASLYLTAGALGDRLGRRRLFAAGCAGFALASAACGLAPSGPALVAGRVAQGVAGAFLTTNSLALLRASFAGESGRAIGTWTAWTGVGTVAGPPLGGLLVQALSWRWIFFVNLPLAALTLLLAAAGRGCEREEHSQGALGLRAAPAAAGGLGLLTYGMVSGTRDGFAGVAWALAAGVACLGAFAWSERRSATPLIPRELRHERRFLAANAITFCVYAALGGTTFFLALYLQSVAVGLGPAAASLVLVPISVIMLLLASRFGRLADRRGPRLPLTAGPLLMALAMLLFGLLASAGVGGVLAAVVVFALGLAMTVAPITSTALSAAPERQAGLAAGVNTTVSRAGGLIAIPLMGIVIKAVFDARAPAAAGDPFAAPAALRGALVDGFRAGMGAAALLCALGAAVAFLAVDDRRARGDRPPAREEA